MSAKHQTSAIPLSTGARLTWKTGQLIALLVTVVVLYGLTFQPELTLKVVWFAVVPLLPASFLVNAGLWRNLCPLATANMIPKRDSASVLTGKWIQWATSIGIILLFVLVPLRRLLLNQEGLALAVTLVAIVVLALATGFFVQVKGGFCNSICPVLPVEKLYGQAPLLFVRNSRCVPCTHCTTKGCLDIDPALSVRTAMGTSKKAGHWLTQPFGLFAASFPGFIYGYFQLDDVGLAAWKDVYTTVFLYALVSLLIIGAASLIFRMSSRQMAPFLGAFSVGMYYWFAAPASFDAFNLSGGEIARWVMVAFVLFWFVRAILKTDRTHANGKNGGSRTGFPPVPATKAAV